MQFNMTDIFTRCALGLIALFLGIIALRPVARPEIVRAESDNSHLYIEPGTTVLRKPDLTQQVEGKVVIDMRSGDIWGFPTLAGTPYPVDLTRAEAPVSAPIYLGKFDFSKITPAGGERRSKP
jgi:hypothetical protein